MRYILLLILAYVNLLAFNAFVTADELKNSLNDKNLIILDISNKDIYKAGHIKNAIHVNISNFIDVDKGIKIASKEKVEREFQNLGVDVDSNLVIYSHNTQESTLYTSYLALLLIQGGFERVSILDGGYMAWVFEYEFFVSTEVTKPSHNGNIKLNSRDIIVDIEYVKNATSKQTLLDARSTLEYYGVSKSQGIKAVGHIPKAKSSYYGDKFLKDGTLRDKRELEQIYIDGHGLAKEDEIIVYAETVFAASMEWYILYKSLNFKNTKIYEQSFMQWGNLEESSITRFKWE